MSEAKTLKDRVRAFNLLQLPGQPQGMHMGTSYLVSDLWRTVEELSEALRKASQFVSIAIDWNFEEAEIDGKMTSSRDVLKELDTALAKARGEQP